MFKHSRTARLTGTAALVLGVAFSTMATVAVPATATATHEAAPSTAMVPRFIVTMDENASADDIANTRNLDNVEVPTGSVEVSGQEGLFDTTVIAADKALNAAEAAQLHVALAKLPGVKNVEPDTVMTTQAGPNDTHYSYQWDLAEPKAGMRLPISSTSYPSGAGTTVAVIDTGMTNHPDLRGVFVGGVDTISDPRTSRDGDGRDTDPSDEGDWAAKDECAYGTDPSPSSWHGTHVAGTIGALTNNRMGVAGVAPGTSIVPVRVLGRCGGYTSDIAAGIMWAAGEKIPGVSTTIAPVDVINMSLGGRSTCDRTTQRAIDTAREKGITVVVAAGNSDRDAKYFSPANCRGVITVAATGREGNRAGYSNYGSTIDIAAPGGDQKGGKYENGILSTVLLSQKGPTSKAGYGFSQGTSMAAPHVAGLAALVKHVKPNFTPTEVEKAIRDNARAVPGNCYMGCGSGLIDATATLKAVSKVIDDKDKDKDPIDGEFLMDFEQNRAVWSESRYGLLNADATYPSASGKYKAQLNGFGKQSLDHISTEFEIPSGVSKAELRFKLFVNSKEFSTRTAYDKLFVQVNGREVAQFSNKDKGSDYVDRVVDLSGYLGEKVTLRFEGQEDSSGRTVFLIDDVALDLTK